MLVCKNVYHLFFIMLYAKIGVVLLGTSSNNYNTVVNQSGDATSYSFISTWAQTPPYTSPFIHFATSAYLQPDTQYYYRYLICICSHPHTYSPTYLRHTRTHARIYIYIICSITYIPPTCPGQLSPTQVRELYTHYRI